MSTDMCYYTINVYVWSVVMAIRMTEEVNQTDGQIIGSQINPIILLLIDQATPD